MVSHHTLEHVPDYLFALGEIHQRARATTASCCCPFPTRRSPSTTSINPYHHHNFTERSFDFFDPLLLKGSAAEDGDTAFGRWLVRFTYMGAFGVLPRPLRAGSRRHLLNVVRQFDVALVAIKDPDRPVDVGPARARELEERVVELKRRREPYPQTAGAAAETMTRRGRYPPRRSGRPPRRCGPRPRGESACRCGALRYRADTVLRRWELRHD